MSKHLSNFFTTDDITGLCFIAHGDGTPTPSARNKGAVVPKHPATRYTMQEAMALKMQKACQPMPSDLHSVQWDELMKESVNVLYIMSVWMWVHCGSCALVMFGEVSWSVFFVEALENMKMFLFLSVVTCKQHGVAFVCVAESCLDICRFPFISKSAI